MKRIIFISMALIALMFLFSCEKENLDSGTRLQITAYHGEPTDPQKLSGVVVKIYEHQGDISDIREDTDKEYISKKTTGSDGVVLFGSLDDYASKDALYVYLQYNNNTGIARCSFIDGELKKYQIKIY